MGVFINMCRGMGEKKVRWRNVLREGWLGRKFMWFFLNVGSFWSVKKWWIKGVHQAVFI